MRYLVFFQLSTLINLEMQDFSSTTGGLGMMGMNVREVNISRKVRHARKRKQLTNCKKINTLKVKNSEQLNK